MRVLTVTAIFPGAAAPAHGVFVLQRVKAMRDAGAEVRVVAPVPYVPPGPLPARYVRTRATPAAETLDGIEVRHPRYFMIPKVGMYLQDRAYARGIAGALREEVERFRPDVLDVHYLYPDACGVARVAPGLGVPFVCSARGSDVKLLGRIPLIARRIRVALAAAAGVVAVSRDLAATMRELDLVRREVRVIPNGIDPGRFFPRDRAEARRALGLPESGRLVVCVGHLAEVHGQELIVQALADPAVPAGVEAYLIGSGHGRAAIARRAAVLGVEGRVHLVGAVPHDEVPLWFSAANASVHPGRWAGCPNAVLESLACGTPCLASDLPEMRELIEAPAQGLLVPREPAAIARGLAALLARDGGRCASAPRTWADVGREVLDWMERSCLSAA